MNDLSPSEIYSTFQNNFIDRQKEQSAHILRLLTFLEQSYENARLQLSPEDRLELISVARHSARSLSNGLFSKIKNEPVNLQNLLHRLQNFFTEKTNRSNIQVQIKCPKNLSFMGDEFLTEFILLNLISKPIYRVPNNGTGEVSILVLKKRNYIELKIQDNGYPLSMESERLIQGSISLLLENTALRQMCVENGIRYECSTIKENVNRTLVILPFNQEEILEGNVVKLFS